MRLLGWSDTTWRGQAIFRGTVEFVKLGKKERSLDHLVHGLSSSRKHNLLPMQYTGGDAGCRCGMHLHARLIVALVVMPLTAWRQGVSVALIQ